MGIVAAYGADRSRIETGEKQTTIHLACPVLRGARLESLSGHQSSAPESSDPVVIATAPGGRVFLAISEPRSGCLAEQTKRAYQRLFAAAGVSRFLRIWNYIPAINQERDGLENYRAFCVGRAEAFDEAAGRGRASAYPAASAVGTDDDILTLYAIAVRTGLEPRYFENPKQIPAYCYPSRYGPRSPSFSRASREDGSTPSLYISGTAAVLGADTVHPHRTRDQLDVMGDNIDRIVNESFAELPFGPDEAATPYMKLYLRDADDADMADRWLRSRFPLAPGAYTILRSDICRAGLKAELELSWPNLEMPAAGRRERIG